MTGEQEVSAVTCDEMLRHVEETYGVTPDYLWERAPEGFALRHPDTKKWFAVAMKVDRAKLGVPGEGKVWLMDTKCGPILSGSFLGQPGVVRAWHMNKTQWIGVLLDGTAPEDTVKELLDISYELTLQQPKRRRSHGPAETEDSL